MSNTEQEKAIIAALKTIRDVCNSNDCGDCPLRMRGATSESCTLLHWAPCNWQLAIDVSQDFNPFTNN